MATQRELNRQISNITSIKTAADTLALVSGAQLSPARSAVSNNSSFEADCRRVLSVLRHNSGLKNHPFFAHERPDDTADAWIVYGADSGLTGSMDHLTCQEAIKSADRRGNPKLWYAVGTRAARILTVSGRNPTMLCQLRDSFQVADLLPDYFDQVVVKFLSGEIASVSVCRPVCHGMSEPRPAYSPLLPVPVLTDDNQRNFEFGVEAESLEGLCTDACRLWFQQQLFRAALETEVSRHMATMMTMQRASQGASDMITDLTVEALHQRRSAINRSITEAQSS